MARGRKPQPTAIKLLKGTQPCRVNAAEPVYPAGAPEPPAYLAGGALDLWHELAPLLAGSGVLTAADRHGLAALCVAFLTWRADPAAPKACAHYRAMLAEFGLTPSSRSRVRVAGAKADDLAEFLKKQA